MGELVVILYHPEKNALALYKYNRYDYWMGEPYVVWKSLEIAIGYGWQVIGEL